MPPRNPVGDRSRASSSSSKSSSEDASIYFRVLFGRTHHWFVIKGDSSTPDSEILHPYLTPEPMFLEFPGVAAVGSTIYLLGGSDIDYCKRFPYIHCPPSMYDVYYINTLCPKDVWRRSRYSMNQPRSRTHAVTVDGKIYVFGGSETCPTSVSPEVFDTRFEDQGWRDLKNDPSVPGWIYGHAVSDKRIFMFSLPIKELYYYDVEADSWGVYSEKFGLYRRTSAFVDGILYFIDNSAIFGFDISKPDSLPKIVRGLEDDEGCHGKWVPHPERDGYVPDAHLVSLGNGKLAVVSAVLVYHGSEEVLRVSCSKIKMGKEENTAGEVDFVAHPLSLSYYYARGFILIDCVAVFPSEKMEGREDFNKDDNSTATDDKNNGGSSSSNNDYYEDSKNKKKKKKKNKKKKNKN